MFVHMEFPLNDKWTSLGNCLKYRRVDFGGEAKNSKQIFFFQDRLEQFGKVAHYIVDDEQRECYQWVFVFPSK